MWAIVFQSLAGIAVVFALLWLLDRHTRPIAPPTRHRHHDHLLPRAPRSARKVR